MFDRHLFCRNIYDVYYVLQEHHILDGSYDTSTTTTDYLKHAEGNTFGKNALFVTERQ